MEDYDDFKSKQTDLPPLERSVKYLSGYFSFKFKDEMREILNLDELIGAITILSKQVSKIHDLLAQKQNKY